MSGVIHDNHLKVLEKFVIQMYNKKVTESNLDSAQKSMIFQKGCQPEQLPPTSTALKFHALRSLLQAGHVWGQSLRKNQIVADPSQFG